MHPNAPGFLWDAKEAATNARDFVQGISYERYRADVKLQSAVERQLEIVGEALSRLRKVDEGTAEQIPEVHKIIGMRNLLIHGYRDINDEDVWSAAIARTQPLIEALEKLLSEYQQTKS
jgi:uncharacterized protein with HEPN domain